MYRKIFLIVLVFSFCSASIAQSFKWAQKAGSPGFDFAKSIDTDHNGNVFLMGGFNNTLVFPGTGTLASRSITSAGGWDLYLSKMDCNKNLVWKNTIGSTGNELGSNYFIKIKYDNKSSLYAAGTFNGSATFTTTSGSAQTLVSSGGDEIFLAKYDTNGVLKWVINCGGTDNDEGTDCNIDYNGDVLLTGCFKSTATFRTKSGPSTNLVSTGVFDIFIAKYDTAGILKWANKAGSPLVDVPSSICADNQNNIYVGGNFAYGGATATFGSLTIGNAGFWGAFVAKATSSGSWIWVNGMGGPGSEGINGIVVDDSCNVYSTGNYSGSSATFSSSSPGVPITITNNGQFDVNLVALDSAGVLKWAKSVGGPGVEYSWNICLANNNRVVSSGNFENTSNFGNGFSATSSGGSDGFVCVLERATGTTVNTFKTGGTGNDYSYATVSDHLGNLYNCGYFSGTAAFGTNSLASSGAEDAYFAKIAPAAPFKLRPVPISLCTGDSILIYPRDTMGGVTFQWYRNNTAIAGANQFSYNAKLAGTYFLKVTNNCSEVDSSENIILSFTTVTVNAGSDVTICKGDSIQLNATGASSYFWSPSSGLSNVSIGSPYAKPADTTNYIVRVTNGVCMAYDTVKVIVKPILAQAGTDSTLCLGDSIRLNGNAIGTFVWQNALFLTDSTALNTFIKPVNTINYILKVTNLGCTKYDTVQITVNNPQASAGADKTICLGDSVQLTGSATGSFKWSPNYYISDSNSLTTYVKPPVSTNYLLTATIGRCFKKDTVQVIVNQVSVQSGADTSLCFGDSIRLTASAVGNIAWQKNSSIADTTILNPFVKPQNTTLYILEARSGLCVKRDTVNVQVYHPTSNAITDQAICLGDSVQLNGTGYNLLKWYPGSGLTDSSLVNTFAKPNITTNYILLAKDGYCFARDTVKINITQVSANAGLDKGICPGDSVQLNASAIGSYHWESNLGLSNYTILNPYAKPAATTQYILTATNSTCVKHDTIQVTVSLPLALNAGKDTSLCIGDSIQLLASGGFNYKWIPNTLVSDSTVFNPFVKPIVTTDFIVKSGFSGCFYYDTVNVLVRNLPLVDAGTGGQICKNDSFLLQGIGTGITRWIPNLLVTDSTALMTYAKPTNTTKYYLKINDGHCANQDSVTINVNNPIPINAGSDQAICEFDSAQLHVTGSSQVRWLSANYLNDSTSLSPKVSPPVTTDFIVKSFNTLCPTFDTVRVTVNSKPIVNAGNDTTICVGFPFQLNAQVTNGDVFSWKPANEVSDPAILNPLILNPKTKYYTLTATNSTGNCTSSDSVKVTMDSVIALISADILQGGTPLKVQFANNSINANSYQWDFDQLDSSTDENPDYIFKNDGTYSVVLTAISSNGCVDTAMLTILANGEIVIHIPNVFTPNNDLINDNFENKVNNFAYLKYLKGTIWNRWGGLIYEYNMPNGKWWDGTYEGSSCPDGVYFYIIEAESKSGKMYKIHGTVTLLR
ncbi:MAG: PKD domain-containing protein [Bacteroidota bacterium]